MFSEGVFLGGFIVRYVVFGHTGGTRTILKQHVSRQVTEIVQALEDAREIMARHLNTSPHPSRDYSVTAGLSPALESLGISADSSLLEAQLQRRQIESSLDNEVSKGRKVVSVWKPWGEPDKKRLADILSRLKYWNGELESIFQRHDIASLHAELSARTLSTFAQSPETLRAVAKVAEDGNDDELMASANLAVQVLESEHNADQNSFRIPLGRLRTANPEQPEGQTGLAEGQTLQHQHGDSFIDVYVEWLDYSDLDHEQTGIATNRLNALCRLLNLSKPANLPTLKSNGFVQDRHRQKFGLVFELPAESGKIISLHEIIASKATQPHSFPRWALGKRYMLARRLCWAFLELQKAQWLHRGFNSLCVLLAVSKEKESDHEKASPFHDSSSFIGIGGSQYARPLGRDQVSLPVDVEGRGKALLCHHPCIRQNLASPSDSTTPTAYVKYQPWHDIYSLGLVLLEIRLWKAITSIKDLKQECGPQVSQKRLLSIAKNTLPHSMGQAYADVVCRAIKGPEVGDQFINAKGENAWVLYEIVKPMEDCHCRTYA